jgi:hypothetical protein
MSAARQAAEAAFATPELRPPPTLEVQITVRRTREAPAPKLETPQSSPDAPSVSRGSRVFRIESAQTAGLPEAVSATNALLHEESLRNHGPSPRTAAPLSRAVDNRRPGPVLHLVQTLDAPSEPEQTRPRLDLLAAELARVGTVLDEIKQAQSLKFVANPFAREWERLWRVAAEIRQDIKTQWR